MTRMILASLLAGCLALPAAAQTPPVARPGNEIGTGQSLPLSDKASNIAPADSGTAIAPRLPPPPVSEEAPPAAFLHAAAQALAAGRTGEAQEALERAESRALDRSVKPSLAAVPNRAPLVQRIAQARGALSSGDRARALRLVQTALHDPDATR